MTDLQSWYARCLIQLDIDSDDASVKGALSCFTEDSDWLKYAVNVAKALGMLPEKHTDIRCVTDKQAEYLGLNISGDGTYHVRRDGSRVEKHGSGYIHIQYIPTPRPADDGLRLTQGEVLPRWFLHFFIHSNAQHRFGVDAYLSYKEIGDLGYLPAKTSPEEVLDELVRQGHLKLGIAENSDQKRQVILSTLEYFMARGCVPRKVPAHVHQHVHLAPTTKSNIVSALRKSVKRAHLDFTATTDQTSPLLLKAG